MEKITCFYETLTNCENHCDDADLRLPPPWFEPQIFRLPGKDGYSIRPLGTTSSLKIWVESYVASVTGFPPTEREKGLELGQEGRVRKMELCGRGGKS